jgi:hypothetical protein
MYCPNCAAEASPDQKFCRACGINLQTVSDVLADQRAAAQVEKGFGEMIEEFRSKRQKMFRWGILLLVGSLIIGSSIPALAGLTASGLDVAALIPLAAGITGMVMFTGVMLIVYSQFLPKAPVAPPPLQATMLPPSQVTTELRANRQPEPVSSVTEHTTALFRDSVSPPGPRDTARGRE